MQDAPIQVFHMAWYLKSVDQTVMSDILVCIYYFIIGVAPITQLHTCIIKIVTFKGGHLMWKR